MAVSLSIKEVPDDLAQSLRDRATRNHRSIQGELMHILETAVRTRPFQAAALQRRLHALGFSTAGNAVRTIREDRDRR